MFVNCGLYHCLHALQQSFCRASTKHDIYPSDWEREKKRERETDRQTESKWHPSHLHASSRRVSRLYRDISHEIVWLDPTDVSQAVNIRSRNSRTLKLCENKPSLVDWTGTVRSFYNTVKVHFNSPAWWRHQKETFSALLALCAGKSPVTGEFPTKRPVTRSFDVFFDLRLNKRLSKQSWGW